MTVALLLPITYGLEPTSALIMFAGIYYGGMYGGSTTSILLNTPGESSSVVTAIEGNKMAKAGTAAQALATAAIGSFIAGTIGTTPAGRSSPRPSSKFAVSLGAPEYLAVMLLALRRGDRGPRLLPAARFRLPGAGPDHRADRPRRGHRPAAAHLRHPSAGATASTSWSSRSASSPSARPCGSPPTCAASREVIPVGRPCMDREDWKRSWKPWLRGTAFGFPFGAIPAGGAEIPTFLSYVTEKKLSKHPEEFGHGAIEGVAGPEAANNACAAGTLVPMSSLGLPTNATAAMMLAALTAVRHPARAAAVQQGAGPGLGR